MSHIEIDRTVQMMTSNLNELLKGHGHQIVTEDKQLFPYFTPAVASLQSGRLLVFGLWVFPNIGEFQPEVQAIQDYFRNAVEQNTPETDPRIQFVEKVALVLAPETVEDKAPAGDIHWIGLGNPSELAEKVRRELAL